MRTVKERELRPRVVFECFGFWLAIMHSKETIGHLTRSRLEYSFYQSVVAGMTLIVFVAGLPVFFFVLNDGQKSHVTTFIHCRRPTSLAGQCS